MRNVKLTVEYKGTGYAGWQVQAEQRTIKGEISQAINKTTGRNVNLIGAGRTDAGVHALGNVAHFDARREWEEEALRKGLDSLLPGDIAVTAVRRVPESFHARFDAESRTYYYALTRERDLFYRNRRWFAPVLPDRVWVRDCLDRIRGEHDFASLARADGESKDTTCRVLDVEWREHEAGAVLSVTADRFLYGMVRTLVGTVVTGFARGADTGFLSALLGERRRSAAGRAAPPQGLYLGGVQYPGEERTDAGRRVARLAGLDAGTVPGAMPPVRQGKEEGT